MKWERTWLTASNDSLGMYEEKKKALGTGRYENIDTLYIQLLKIKLKLWFIAPKGARPVN